MRMGYCPNCSKTTGHKRALGWGTFFAVILTGGLWLLVILFYPTRCIVCGAPTQYFAKPHGQPVGYLGEFTNFMLQFKVFWLLPILAVFVFLFGLIILASLKPEWAPFIYTLF